MTRITVSLGEHAASLLAERAAREGRSLSQLARVLIERGLGASPEGEVAAPAVTATSSDTRKVEVRRDTPIVPMAPPVPLDEGNALRGEAWGPEMEAAEAALPPEGVESPTPAKTTVPPPTPPSPPPRSIDDVLGDPKHKTVKGTVSGRQAVLAAEAARRAAERSDMFSLVCPQRDQHVPGTRCPICKGIQ